MKGARGMEEKKAYLVLAVVLTIGLLAALAVVLVNSNNAATALTAAIVGRSNWMPTQTFSFSATGLNSSGGETLDVSGGGTFVFMSDVFWNVWLKGRGSLTLSDEKVHWKTAQTGLFNPLEGTLTFTVKTTGGASSITGPVEVEATQNPNDPTAGRIKVTIGTDVFEGSGIVVTSWPFFT